MSLSAKEPYTHAVAVLADIYSCRSLSAKETYDYRAFLRIETYKDEQIET